MRTRLRAGPSGGRLGAGKRSVSPGRSESLLLFSHVVAAPLPVTGAPNWGPRGEAMTPRCLRGTSTAELAPPPRHLQAPRPGVGPAPVLSLPSCQSLGDYIFSFGTSVQLDFRWSVRLTALQFRCRFNVVMGGSKHSVYSTIFPRTLKSGKSS